MTFSMKKNILSFLFALAFLPAIAQELRCFTSEKMQEQLLLDPDLAQRRAEIEEHTERWIAANGNTQHRAVVTIPVVVHVVYKTAQQNISDAQIFSQIEVLNEDYRMQNADIASLPSVWNGFKADSEIEFRLANVDPDGNPTTGITRTETTVTTWNGSDNVKFSAQGGKDAWPANNYLNIWVCNIGSGLLGFAYPPGVNASLDGLVIGYQFFGRGVPGLSSTYNKGRTATHEIGHYFNLDHLWGTGDSNPNCNQNDGVSDTPIQEGPNFGCPAFPHVTCNNGPNGDMFHNYMDYGNDACLFFFTNGQKQRMLAALNGPRSGLLTSPGVGISERDDVFGGLNVYPNPSNDVLHISVGKPLDGAVDVRLLNLMGAVVLQQDAMNIANEIIAIDHLPAGSYILEFTTSNGRASKRIQILR